MNKETNKIAATIFGIFLLLSGLLYVSPPDLADADQASRVSQAKGHGFLSLAQRWSNRYVFKLNEEKQTGEKEVVGYYTRDWHTDNLSQNSLQGNARHISGVATFSYRVTSSGQIVGTTPKEALKTAWTKNIETYALVHNIPPNSSGFSSALVHTILSDPKLRTEVISNIYSTLVKNGFDGVNIDFEHVPPQDRQALNDFMSELKQKLGPDGLKVTISVPAKTRDNPRDNWSGGFDYKHLGKVADRIMLMTYDEHWLGGAPGPVASYPWVEKVAAYASSVMPKEKVLLGIGKYGYVWIEGKGGYKSVPSRKAAPLATQYGVSIKWDDQSRLPYFKYLREGKRHVVWYESNESAGLKMDLVNKYGLRGIAIWRLGFEDKEFWNMVDKKF